MTSRKTQDAVLESAALAALLLLGNAVFAAERPGFAETALHPGVFAVAFVAFRHGTRGGAIAVAAVASFHWLAVLLLGDVSGVFALVSGDNARVLTTLAVAGASCGWLAQGHIDAVRNALRRASELESDARARDAELESLQDTNAKLAARVIDARKTIPTLARISQRLHAGKGDLAETLGPLLSELVAARGGCLWSASPPQCVHRWGTSSVGDGGSATRSDEFRELAAGLSGGQTLGLDEIAPGQRTTATPFFLGCVGAADRQMYVAVDDMDLDDYGPTSRELFDVVVGWAHALTAGTAETAARPTSGATVARPRPEPARPVPRKSAVAKATSGIPVAPPRAATPGAANRATPTARDFGARLAKLPTPTALRAPSQRASWPAKAPPTPTQERPAPPIARATSAASSTRSSGSSSSNSATAANAANARSGRASAAPSGRKFADGTGELRRVVATAINTAERPGPPTAPLSSRRTPGKPPLRKVFRDVSQQLAPGSTRYEQPKRS